MSMSLKDRRLQVLVERDQYRRLEAEAASRGVSVASVVREAVGHYLDAGPTQVQEAVERILASEHMPVPDPDELRDELDDLRGRRG
jgi:hypothetical protein